MSKMLSSDRKGQNMLAIEKRTAGLGKMFAGATFAMLLPIGLMPAEAQADDACHRLAGAYLVNVISGGSLFSREVLTLTSDGNAFVIDSNEGGVTGVFNPFSSQQGSWSCRPYDPAFQATATLLSFSFAGSVPGGQNVDRVDFKIKSNPGSKTISGTLDLRFFPLKGNPLVKPLPAPAASFTFTGVAIK